MHVTMDIKRVQQILQNKITPGYTKRLSTKMKIVCES